MSKVKVDEIVHTDETSPVDFPDGITSGGAPIGTPSDADIKIGYENNANTNAFTTAEQTAVGVNSAKTGITPAQAADIVTNSAHSASLHAPDDAEANEATVNVFAAGGNVAFIDQPNADGQESYNDGPDPGTFYQTFTLATDTTITSICLEIWMQGGADTLDLLIRSGTPQGIYVGGFATAAVGNAPSPGFVEFVLAAPVALIAGQYSFSIHAGGLKDFVVGTQTGDPYAGGDLYTYAGGPVIDGTRDSKFQIKSAAAGSENSVVKTGVDGLIDASLLANAGIVSTFVPTDPDTTTLEVNTRYYFGQNVGGASTVTLPAIGNTSIGDVIELHLASGSIGTLTVASDGTDEMEDANDNNTTTTNFGVFGPAAHIFVSNGTKWYVYSSDYVSNGI